MGKNISKEESGKFIGERGSNTHRGYLNFQQRKLPSVNIFFTQNFFQ